MARPLRSRAAPPEKKVTRFRMASARAAVAPAVERVLRAARPAGLDDEQRDNLAVAMAEALSNAAVHGNALDARREVSVTVEVEADGRVVVEVADEGKGFDHGGVVDPTDPARRLIPGGRGVFLMRRLVDRLEYNEAGNAVRLVVSGRRRHGPASSR
jgi:serine/threonine-protein kinase RsbW